MPEVAYSMNTDNVLTGTVHLLHHVTCGLYPIHLCEKASCGRVTLGKVPPNKQPAHIQPTSGTSCVWPSALATAVTSCVWPSALACLAPTPRLAPSLAQEGAALPPHPSPLLCWEQEHCVPCLCNNAQHSAWHGVACRCVSVKK